MREKRKKKEKEKKTRIMTKKKGREETNRGKSTASEPKQTLKVLAIQIGAAIAALAPVFLLGL